MELEKGCTVVGLDLALEPKCLQICSDLAYRLVVMLGT